MENSTRPEAPAPTSPPVVHPTHRGLYITLGAVLVFAVVALGGIYVPKYAKTHALGGNSAATAPAATPAPVAPVAAAPAAVPATPAAPAPAAATPAKPAVPAVPAPPPGPDPKVLQGLRDQIDQINSRAAAVDAGLDSLERQQEAQGYGLRGDMVAGRQRMHADIARAESSLHDKDVDSTQNYLSMAEAEAEKLEQFLGR
jgi:type IV secretory pathway VirB10-like protein